MWVCDRSFELKFQRDIADCKSGVKLLKAKDLSQNIWNRCVHICIRFVSYMPTVIYVRTAVIQFIGLVLFISQIQRSSDDVTKCTLHWRSELLYLLPYQTRYVASFENGQLGNVLFF